MCVVAACSDDDDPTPASAPSGDGGADAGTSQDASPNDAGSDAPIDTGATITGFTLMSTAFTPGGNIPATYTCNGAGTSFPLAWVNAPRGTASFALVMRDLSLPGSMNYHWVMWNIPPDVTSLPPAVENEPSPKVPAGAQQSQWSFGQQYGYGNPCPPPGTTHDYQVTIYALSVATVTPASPDDPVSADAAIQAAPKLGSASLTGKYTRP